LLEAEAAMVAAELRSAASFDDASDNALDGAGGEP
jgi:hypothetical protein